ncbi:zinc-ribbon domain-containing protein [Herbiconiux sp. L3-i23]|uniref:zinc-ribbon domain-containing protein n=1 Tax=Herbiconiux sp. L3-i23 TaxID=2905871 RepID=UPI00205CFC7C|nr:zinc-ribbon domain-containing protein [Herbiconiux sp. L3-i23]BDI22613.1 hypothetical protein L3i23_13890 [Herbiconiux sp. L3-i23]
MFFLLMGTRPELTEINRVSVTCPYCDKHVAQHVMRQRSRFTVFFVPLFSFGSRFFVQCSNCGGTTALTEQQAQNSLTWAADRTR